ncbi:MAG: hypothetical protein K8S62_08445 [Candidatus Sabulitectum sp.]|nr:hypothetical protein [Candidatus Sabulitectum sp.]
MHSGAEVDLILDPKGLNLGFEFNFSETVRTTRSMRMALDDLALNHLYIVYPGDDSFKIDEKISALSISDVADTVSGLLRT